MAVQPANPNSTPPTLTQAQTRALLHTLLSSTPNATRPNTNSPPARSRTAGPQPVQQTTTISIDASTRIMGHCNNVALASPSATEQAAKIEQLLRGVIKSTEPGVPQTNARANANVNVTIQAGVSVMGSKNVVVLDGKRVVGSKETVPGDEALAGRKRRAESEPTDVQTTPGKKVKAES